MTNKRYNMLYNNDDYLTMYYTIALNNPNQANDMINLVTDAALCMANENTLLQSFTHQFMMLGATQALVLAAHAYIFAFRQ